MNIFFKIGLIYFAVISLLTAFITVLDKFLSKKNMRRIPENTLFILAFFGGSIAEYITMKAVRHKTLHKKFMVGLPLITVFQIILIITLIMLNNH